MTTLKITLPDDISAEVDAQAIARGYATPSDYVVDLIRRDLDRQVLRDLLDRGARSAPGEAITGQTLEDLRQRAAGKTD